MAAYAVVQDGVVQNVVEWDGESEWSPPEGASLEQIDEGVECGIGWTYDGSTYVKPKSD